MTYQVLGNMGVYPFWQYYMDGMCKVWGMTTSMRPRDWTLGLDKAREYDRTILYHLHGIKIEEFKSRVAYSIYTDHV